MGKVCSKCKIEKNESEFYKDKTSKDGLCSHCKKCRKQYCIKNKEIIKIKQEKYRKENKEKLLQQSRDFYYQNKEKIAQRKKEYNKLHYEQVSQRHKRWYIKNRDKELQRDKKYRSLPATKLKKANRRKERMQTDTQFKMTNFLRCRLRTALKGNCKLSSAVHDLGCSIEFLLEYLKKNYDGDLNDPTLSIDHIIPARMLDLTIYSHQRLFCHYYNLRYMPLKDNIQRKYNDIIEYKELVGLALEALSI